MTIGSVFGRIAGREAAANARELRRCAEADRLMVVCNSCRYCEGLCAVFPAMEMRRVFPDGDLNYLANLCHGCGACYVDCQFSPPHEFDVNVPRVLRAGARRFLPRLCLAARAVRPVRAQRARSAVIAALSVAAFVFGFVAFDDPPALFGGHRGPGAFYRADAARRDGVAFRRRVPLCDRRDRDGRAHFLARHRRAVRDAGRAALAPAGDQGRLPACAISTAAASAA